jgi:chromate transporter
MVLLKIFFSFLKISMFAIGGAYSFLPLVEKEVVERNGWLDKQEFLEVVGMVEVFPGAISIKFATYTGYKAAGVPGAIVANIANMLPPIVLILIAAHLYTRYRGQPAVKAALTMIQCAVFAMLIALALRLVNKPGFLELKSVVVIIASFAVFMFTRIHPAFVIIGAGIVGALL